MTQLPILCPQMYDPHMRVTICTRCAGGWDRHAQRCVIETGCEHLPTEDEIPTCPIQERCRHQIQSVDPCAVRARGLICESALAYAGVFDPMEHPLGFNADCIARTYQNDGPPLPLEVDPKILP